MVKHTMGCAVSVFLLVFTVPAKLVPKNLCDGPPAQRLTATVAVEEWQALSPNPPMPVWTKSFIVEQ
jgi:hypothetical protein